MHLKFRNVNSAFRELVYAFKHGQTDKLYPQHFPTSRVPSRVGEVIKVDEPVTITYTHPQERVLFNRVRDANPFFHLYESLWMLAGRNDVAPLTYYSSQYGKIVSDDGITQNAAYGYRWRNNFRLCYEPTERCFVEDQLNSIVVAFRKNPNCRRQVLTMWDPSRDLNVETKDTACNTHAYFLIRQKEEHTNDWDCSYPVDNHKYLDMTVCNRSNDMIWGMLGANVVHFSFLQEYLAAKIGVEVGVYNQFTNNLHVYTERWLPDAWLDDDTPDFYRTPMAFPYEPLVRNPELFDAELPRFVELHSKDSLAQEFNDPFLMETAQPMCVSFHHYKRDELTEALQVMDSVEAPDWRIAGVNWLERRAKKRADSHNV